MSKKKPHALAEIGDTVTDTLSDAWSTTAALAHELATSAIDAANELTTVAGSGVSEGVERVGALYGQARDRVVPPRRRRVNPWLVAAAVASLVAFGWWRRRQQAADQTVRATAVDRTASVPTASPIVAAS